MILLRCWKITSAPSNLWSSTWQKQLLSWCFFGTRSSWNWHCELPPPAGVSVCFRYVTDLSYVNQFFTLRSAGSYSNSLVLNPRSPNTFTLSFNQYSLYLAPNNKFHASSNGVWTSVCLTLDNEKKVAQVFSGSMMSIRKIMLTQVSQQIEIMQQRMV